MIEDLLIFAQSGQGNTHRESFRPQPPLPAGEGQRVEDLLPLSRGERRLGGEGVCRISSAWPESSHTRTFRMTTNLEFD
jgi:hypothetical protein